MTAACFCGCQRLAVISYVTLIGRRERVVRALMHDRVTDADRYSSWRRARCWFAGRGDIFIRGVDLESHTAGFAHQALSIHDFTLAGELSGFRERVAIPRTAEPNDERAAPSDERAAPLVPFGVPTTGGNERPSRCRYRRTVAISSA
jgi:hypothetical protein